MQTEFTRKLNIEAPIMNAPMTPHAGGLLAKAVSDAGGLGMIGFDEGESVDSLRQQVALAREGNPNRVFGIGLVHWVVEKRPELIDLTLACKPNLVCLSFGDPAPYIQRFREAGILVASQVQSLKWANVAHQAGVDFLIVQGTEAGGHTGAVGTLPLLQLVLEAISDKPVLAAGGIATGRGLAAVLAAGAAGAVIGTPFLAAQESRGNPASRDFLFQADETQTVLTSVFDRIQRKGWPAEFRGRALSNAFLRQWHGQEDMMMATPNLEKTYQDAKKTGDFSTACIYAGQTVGLVNKAATASDIIQPIVQSARQRLHQLCEIAP
jgi:nitronate monooxygenase